MLKRDLFTGEWVEEPTCVGGRQILARGKAIENKKNKGKGAYDRPWISQTLGVANPEQIGQFNEAAKAYGGGFYFRPSDGAIVCESRGARNNALRFFNKIDMDAGYGDAA